jgi:hypothetical protein
MDHRQQAVGDRPLAIARVQPVLDPPSRRSGEARDDAVRDEQALEVAANLRKLRLESSARAVAATRCSARRERLERLVMERDRPRAAQALGERGIGGLERVVPVAVAVGREPRSPGSRAALRSGPSASLDVRDARAARSGVLVAVGMRMNRAAALVEQRARCRRRHEQVCPSASQRPGTLDVAVATRRPARRSRSKEHEPLRGQSPSGFWLLENTRSSRSAHRCASGDGRAGAAAPDRSPGQTSRRAQAAARVLVRARAAPGSGSARRSANLGSYLRERQRRPSCAGPWLSHGAGRVCPVMPRPVSPGASTSSAVDDFARRGAAARGGVSRISWPVSAARATLRSRRDDEHASERLPRAIGSSANCELTSAPTAASKSVPSGDRNGIPPVAESGDRDRCRERAHGTRPGSVARDLR